jgi:hypothetical protein
MLTMRSRPGSISTFSENLHENLSMKSPSRNPMHLFFVVLNLGSGIRPDDVLGDALNIKSLRGIETFMHLL